MDIDDLCGGEDIGYSSFQIVWRNHQINIAT